ncbi:MAG: class I SAM-dependent methyltransferase [Opitutaceae bacterium]|nr:class I SAM-dependent methyltransferase [Opitutaceae bacterium]
MSILSLAEELKPAGVEARVARRVECVAVATATACGLCGGGRGHPLEERDRDGRPLRVVVCDRCGVVRNDPIPTAEELSRFYAESYRLEYKRTREPKRRHAARYFPVVAAQIEKHADLYGPARDVLDVGSGSGEFLFLMQALGKTARGLEPSRDYAEFCRTKLGLEVETGEIGGYEPKGKFDHIRLSHVVEHLRDPAGSLRTVAGWLREGGTIYVQVPSFEAYCRTKSAGGMFHFGHIYTFDADSFDRLLAAAGLEVVRRVGPTVAFARRAACGPVDAGEAAPALIAAKQADYAVHKAGKAQRRSRVARLLGKLRKRWAEWRRMGAAGDFRAIGERQAEALRRRLGVA